MNKTKLIDYLTKQYNIAHKNLGFEAYKLSTISVLDQVFGLGNKYTLQLQNINEVQIESLEELYPKMITDEAQSIEQFNLSIQNIIEQIDLLEPELLKKDKTTLQLNNKIYKALQNYFSETEISKLKSIIADKKTTKTDLLEHLRIIETDKRLNLLAEMLNDLSIYQ